jgi:hypothetical protein
MDRSRPPKKYLPNVVLFFNRGDQQGYDHQFSNKEYAKSGRSTLIKAKLLYDGLVPVVRD